MLHNLRVDENNEHLNYQILYSIISRSKSEFYYKFSQISFIEEQASCRFSMDVAIIKISYGYFRNFSRIELIIIM